MPDLDTTGIAVTIGGGGSATPLVADDFECRQPGYITEVQLWIAEKDDNDAFDLNLQHIVLWLFSNLPDSLSPSGFAQPDTSLWLEHFIYPSQMDLTVWDPDIREGWYEGDHHVFPADTACWHVTLPIPPERSFYQTGTPENPQTYWLVAHVEFGWFPGEGPVGWKASYEHWNAPAVLGWTSGCIPWCQLIYPPSHEFAGKQMDMAFRVINDPGLELDWGDAPDDFYTAAYPTLYFHDGARHIIGGPWFGDATDDPDGDDDENGVQIPVLVNGENAGITIEVSGGGGFVQGWIDFNHDETWDNSTEMVIAQALADGVHVLPVLVPSSALTGPSFARFHINSVGDLGPVGRAEDGEVEDYEVTIQYPGTGVDDETIPKRFDLYQSVPNPFNPVTTIRFDVVKRSAVRLAVYNVQGQLVRVLVERRMDPGRHDVEWDGTDASGRSLASGVYFYRLVTPFYTESKKMILLR